MNKMIIKIEVQATTQGELIEAENQINEFIFDVIGQHVNSVKMERE